MPPILELQKTFTFEASHILPKHSGKCSRLHGHSWVLTVCVSGEVNKATGFVVDYATLSDKVKPLIDRLDHRHLGTWELDATIGVHPGLQSENYYAWRIPGMSVDFHTDFYPSSENLIVWIGDQLADMGLNWSKLILNETCTSACVLTRKEWHKGI